MVQAKTVDLLVPAEAEVVIEGFVSTELLEPEAPFGESHGHVNLQEYNGYADVTAITRRRDAVITSWVSQVTPSESSAIKRPAYEAAQIEHLRDHLGIKGVKHVATHEPLTSLHKLIVVVVERETPRTEIWRALYGVASLRRAEGKWVIAVNEDIDPDDTNAGVLGDVLPIQAASRRRDPQAQGRRPRPAQPDRQRGQRGSGRRDAEGDLPAGLAAQRQYMEAAAEIWNELGLPKLKPERPWFGYDLGEWNEDPGIDGAPRRAQRILGDRADHRPAPAERRFDEHRGPDAQRG